VIEQKHGVSNSHRPQGRIGNIGPMDRGMQHHCASHIHHRQNGSLGDAGLMMSSSTSKAGDLGKLAELVRVPS
jgi:hypothetical protein